MCVKYISKSYVFDHRWMHGENVHNKISNRYRWMWMYDNYNMKWVGEAASCSFTCTIYVLTVLLIHLSASTNIHVVHLNITISPYIIQIRNLSSSSLPLNYASTAFKFGTHPHHHHHLATLASSLLLPSSSWHF